MHVRFAGDLTDLPWDTVADLFEASGGTGERPGNLEAEPIEFA